MESRKKRNTKSKKRNVDVEKHHPSCSADAKIKQKMSANLREFDCAAAAETLPALSPQTLPMFNYEVNKTCYCLS